MSNVNEDDIFPNNSSIKTFSQKKYIKNIPVHLKKGSTSLFSEIMKNYSNSPDISLPKQSVKGNPVIVDFLDIPLPESSPLKSSKGKSSRKRHFKSAKEESMKRIRSESSDIIIHSSTKMLPLPNIPTISSPVKSEKKEKEIVFKKPKICESRSKNCNYSNERSVKSFKIIAEVGEGTYGHVFKAIDRKTGSLKALKKIRLENEREGFPITTVREIKILHKLNHPNIIRLNEVVTDYDFKSNMNTVKGFYLVFEYMDHDLYGILDSGITLADNQVASFMKQIISGICYCHKRKFLHRDIKSSNILVNNKGEVKIADFGLARRYEADNVKRPYTNKVITLWYRAPELLLGEEIYGEAIDVWSIGCIMGELFTRRTMFTASNEMDQLEAISKVCGTPNIGVWPNVSKLPLFSTFRPKYNFKRRLREYYCTLPNSALDVLDWMLQLDPKRRCSSEQALNSYWLRKIDPKQIQPPAFPADKDYHELSCKRRHKQDHSETGDKSSKSSIKVPQSSSSSNPEENVTNVKQDFNGIYGEKSGSFELPDHILAELKLKLGSLLPGGGGIDELLLNADSLSETNGGDGDCSRDGGGGITNRLEQLLEPYIKEIISDNFLNSASHHHNKFIYQSESDVKKFSENTINHSKSFSNFLITEDSNDSCHQRSNNNNNNNNHSNSNDNSNPKTQSTKFCKYV